MGFQKIFVAAVLTFIFTVASSSHDDEIRRLPGQPPVTFRQYGGYIEVDRDRALFYYFVEAEREAASKPLVLWLNGGPGCSSLGIGAFFSHGPFHPIDASTLRKNIFSWNTDANILYLESPAGVGFSYSTNKSFYIDLNDEMTAQDNLVFLQRWFDKFPQYKKVDFFLTGENYAGHYVPQLAQLIVKSGLEFVPKGIAIGNPFLDFPTDFNAEDEYYWSHAMISDSAYKLLTSVCNSSTLLSQGIRGFLTKDCTAVSDAVRKELSPFLPEFDIQGDVCTAPSQLHGQSQILFDRSFRSAINKVDHQKSDPCLGPKIVRYLNRKSVQKALHARLVGVAQWTQCSRFLQYDFRDIENPTISLVGSLVKAGIRIMAYSGDEDSVIPFTATRTLIKGLAKELGLHASVPYRAWLEAKQVAGWTEVYGVNQLSFAVIRGGGNSAAASEPKRALALFKAFLEGKPLPGA